MGVMADSIAEYAKVLTDKTDGSLEQMQQAMNISTFCWNLALTPKSDQEESIKSFTEALNLDAEASESIRHDIIYPMLERHEEMFPHMQTANFNHSQRGEFQSEPREKPTPVVPFKNDDTTGRNEPCPCNSGKKYKKCCGK